MSGQRALVTGGSRGIGAAVVRRLAADGASVAIGYRSSGGQADALAEEVRGHGGTAVTVQADVGDLTACRPMVEQAVEGLGGLDVLVCCAGVEHFGALGSITPEDFWTVFATNTGGQLFTVQAAAAVMGEGARIVLTSSVSCDGPVFQHTLYPASKAAVRQIVSNLALELSPRGIRINAVSPGGTRTDMAAAVAEEYTAPALRDVPAEKVTAATVAMGRLARPEEIAGAIAFLLSDDAAYVTGSTLSVDGGSV